MARKVVAASPFCMSTTPELSSSPSQVRPIVVFIPPVNCESFGPSSMVAAIDAPTVVVVVESVCPLLTSGSDAILTPPSASAIAAAAAAAAASSLAFRSSSSPPIAATATLAHTCPIIASRTTAHVARS